ncbi:MAG: hypothetical protein J5372_06930 [Lachnospiraceae bacterium]|nr:hypothetical protein [Lachnospiraceae bacterium]
MKKILSCLLLVLLSVCLITPDTANAAVSAVNTKLKQKVYWCGNKDRDYDYNLYVFKYAVK